jgi:hypothetical protein
MDPDAVDWAGIARHAAARWRHHSYGEELEATAMFAAWRHRDEPPGLIYVAARAAMIDDLRHWTGGRYRTSPGRVGQRMTSSRDDIEHYVGSQPAPERPSVAYGLEGRMAYLIDGLWEGFTKDELARLLGLHPSRVSQLLRDLRQQVQED